MESLIKALITDPDLIRFNVSEEYASQLLDFFEDEADPLKASKTYILDNSGFYVSMRFVDGSIVELEVKGSDTVLAMKEKLEAEHGDPADKVMAVYCSKVLENTKTLAECGIKSETIVNVVVKKTKPSSSPASTTSNTSVAVLAETLRTLPGLVHLGMTLEYATELIEYFMAEADPLKAASDYIYNYETTPAAAADGADTGEYSVTLQFLSGFTVILLVSGTDTVLDLKKKLQASHGDNPDEVKMIFAGKVLEDEKTLEEYRLTAGSRAHVLKKLPDEPSASSPPASTSPVAVL